MEAVDHSGAEYWVAKLEKPAVSVHGLGGGPRRLGAAVAGELRESGLLEGVRGLLRDRSEGLGDLCGAELHGRGVQLGGRGEGGGGLRREFGGKG